jgi:hypothetical protein
MTSESTLLIRQTLSPVSGSPTGSTTFYHEFTIKYHETTRIR